jgi:GrpB-like predicted nucleotidyltransferase (UPF0157 family)
MSRHPSLDERFDPAIRIVAHDPGWAPRAAAELERVAAALGPEVAVRLEHVGSTAVPGLAAKPIVDLLVGVDAMEPRERYVPALEGLGYLFAPDPGSPDRHFFAKPPRRPRAFHLHVCRAGGPVEEAHVAVRDHLRAHPDEAAAYAAVKRAVAERHPRDRLAYVEGKHDHVVALERRALDWARGRAEA